MASFSMKRRGLPTPIGSRVVEGQQSTPFFQKIGSSRGEGMFRGVRATNTNTTNKQYCNYNESGMCLDMDAGRSEALSITSSHSVSATDPIAFGMTITYVYLSTLFSRFHIREFDAESLHRADVKSRGRVASVCYCCICREPKAVASRETGRMCPRVSEYVHQDSRQTT